MKSRNLGVSWALVCVALLASALLPSAGAFAAGPADQTNGSWPDAAANGNASTRKPRTVPYWTSSFKDPTNNTVYPFTMVGSDPSLGQSTTVETRIIPLSFTFVAGAQDVSVLNIPPANFPPNGYVATAQNATMNAADNVADTIASPIFTPTNFAAISGDTGVQYGDAFARAQFGKVGTGYHVILGQPRVAETVSIQVPETDGFAVLSPAGVLVGRVDSVWFKERLAQLIDEMELKPTVLPIFLTNNVGLYSNSNFSPISLGGHGAGSPASNAPISLAGKEKIRTFVFAAYLTPNGFSRNPALSDILALSHEIAEWIDNPFGTNLVQPYQIPTAPGKCSSDLETVDVLAGVWFPMPGNPNPAAGRVWHPQDGAFLNWFARNGEDPGLAPDPLQYTFAGPMTTAMGGPFAAFGKIAQAC